MQTLAPDHDRRGRPDPATDRQLAPPAATVGGIGRWTATALAFPPAGLLAITAVTQVDDPVAAVGGGLLAGAGIGLGQWVALRPWSARPERLAAAWIGGTSLGLAVGLTIGTAAVGYDTSVPSLAVVGLASGAAIGVAQARALGVGHVVRDPATRRWWAAAMPLLWALGWVVTASAGVDVERQYAVFGASGALVSSLLGAVLLRRLRRHDANAAI